MTYIYLFITSDGFESWTS